MNKKQKESLAVVISICIVLWFLGGVEIRGIFAGARDIIDPFTEVINGDNITSRLTGESATTAAVAWSVFEQYLDAAGTANLSRVTELSYQISDACSDPEQIDQCNYLMNSVYHIGEVYRERDFDNVLYDSRQVILYTDFDHVVNQSLGLNGIVQTILYFVRDEGGSLKVLGMNFCFPNQDGEFKSCVDTDPARLDKDNNGWWDDVERLFY